MPCPLGQMLPGALGKFLNRLEGEEDMGLDPMAFFFFNFNSITQKLENLSSVHSIQVQVLGHYWYADSITNLPLMFCFHISLVHPLFWFLAAPQIFFSIFSIVSLVLQPHFITLLPSGLDHDLFLICRHHLLCIPLDESVLLSVHGISVPMAILIQFLFLLQTFFLF